MYRLSDSHASGDFDDTLLTQKQREGPWSAANPPPTGNAGHGLAKDDPRLATKAAKRAEMPWEQGIIHMGERIDGVKLWTVDSGVPSRS
jgi:hypothetical protein